MLRPAVAWQAELRPKGRPGDRWGHHTGREVRLVVQVRDQDDLDLRGMELPEEVPVWDRVVPGSTFVSNVL
jgi:hypothetical protein